VFERVFELASRATLGGGGLAGTVGRRQNRDDWVVLCNSVVSSVKMLVSPTDGSSIASRTRSVHLYLSSIDFLSSQEEILHAYRREATEPRWPG
jgi:hypothetical protein